MAISGGRGIEDMLGLPHLDDMMKEAGVDHLSDDQEAIDREAIAESLGLMDAASTSIAFAEGSDHARSMDEIHKETLKHSRELMDLAYNVDDRARRGILEIATSMYRNAMDAKNSKRDMQLKAWKLTMDQQKADLDERKFRADMGENVVDTASVVVEDRNELIKRIRAQAKEEQNTPDK